MMTCTTLPSAGCWAGQSLLELSSPLAAAAARGAMSPTRTPGADGVSADARGYGRVRDEEEGLAQNVGSDWPS